jgi:hypothetical protein
MQQFSPRPDVLPEAQRRLWDELRAVPEELIDSRSWAYWNVELGRFPPPPLPKRTFASAAGSVAGSGTSNPGI